MPTPRHRIDAPLDPRLAEATRRGARLGAVEFVALAASMMAMFALSVDMILPSLGSIGRQLGVERASDNQYVISLVILGMAVGQLFYGPLSDSVGRKPSILVGLGVFGVGCLTSLLASDFRVMLVGRFLQGLGAAGPRIVTVALVRDQYAGAAMARIMSIVVAVLMVGPLLAPFLGQGILLVAHWRVVFLALLVLDLANFAWLTARQPETLPRARRTPFSWRPLAAAVREVLGSRVALGYTAAAGIAFGELFAYVSSAPQIFQDQYGVGAWFPLCLSASGVTIAVASLLNSRWVTRVGMRRLCLHSVVCEALLATVFLVVAWAHAGTPPLWATLALFAAVFFCVGILFGNLNALAMEPLGHIAGVAAGVVGSLTWLLAMLLAMLIGQGFDGTVLPLVVGFLVLSVASLAVLRWVEAGHELLV